MRWSACVAFMLLLLCLSGRVEDYAAALRAAATGYEDSKAEAEPLIRTHGLKINVAEMDKALAFYTGKLGFEIADRSAYPDYVILKTGDRNRLILFRVKRLSGNSRTDTQLSFTLQVNDLDEAITRMRSLGVEFGEAERRKEGVGSAIYIKDPFGRLISLMHQTIVKVEPFKEPKLYNFGFLVPEMETARDFYSNKLGFVVRSEKYLPLDLPLGHRDNKSFAFMLHYRPWVNAIKSGPARGAPFNTLLLETGNLQAAIKELKERDVKILDASPRKGALGNFVALEDPFGNVLELLEVAR